MQDLLGPQIFMSNAAAVCQNAISTAATHKHTFSFLFALTETTEKHFSFLVSLILII